MTANNLKKCGEIGIGVRPALGCSEKKQGTLKHSILGAMF